MGQLYAAVRPLRVILSPPAAGSLGKSRRLPLQFTEVNDILEWFWVLKLLAAGYTPGAIRCIAPPEIRAYRTRYRVRNTRETSS